MRASKYKTDMAQMEKKGKLNPDADMFLIQEVEERPKLLSTIMAQLSLNAGIKQWRKKVRETIMSEMSQLHLQNTFEPRHQYDPTNKKK